MREVPRKKNIDLESMQVNSSKGVTSMTKRGFDIRTD